jgi:2-methylcitrate dehydratase
MSSNVKAYPCVATAQSIVAAALKMHRQLDGKVDGLKRIEVTLIDHPFIIDQQSDPHRVHPDSREGADHSFQYVAAAALTDGAFSTAQFDNERWLDPKIIGLMSVMVMKNDAALIDRAPGTYPCIMRVEDVTGREHVVEQLFPPGYSRGGIVAEDVIEKFQSVAAHLGADVRERIVKTALELDQADSPEQLFSAMRT